MKIKHVLLLILSVLILSACIQTKLRNHNQSPVIKPVAITLQVKGNGGSAKMSVRQGPMHGCNGNGCIVIPHNEKGEITFDMGESHTGFHITELKICMGATPPKDLKADCRLNGNSFEFYVLDPSGIPRIPNPFTGNIKWDYSDNIRTFVLHNWNRLAQEYYYSVEACDNSSNCPRADPPMDNKGLN